MSRIMWSELFPTKWSFVIFTSYMLLFVNQGILVTISQGPQNDYAYDTVTVVLLTEALKLILSILLYCKDHKPLSLLSETNQHRHVLGWYFVPAFLYCIYNNLTFANLSIFDPTTYNLLLQLRVVITGILFQIIFQKRLSRKQWISLVLLTMGCMLKAVDFDKIYQLFYSSNVTKNQSKINYELTIFDTVKSVLMEQFTGFSKLLLIFVQVMCSCLAGVYNEHLLKTKGLNVNIFVQNVFMYVDSIICNILVITLQGKLFDSFTHEKLATIFLHYKVLLVMFNSAVVGIITSLFLKSLNSILKTFASALELVFTAILTYLFLNIPIHLNTGLAIVVVSYSVYLYSKSPVVNTVTTIKRKQMDNQDDIV